jgi:hypothetical protein
MSTEIFKELLGRYATNDLFKMSKRDLILEVIWLRYLYNFELAKRYKGLALGGQNKGKKPGEVESKYEKQTAEIFSKIIERVLAKKKIRRELIESDLALDGKLISSYMVKKTWSIWLANKEEIIASLLANESTLQS